MEPKDDVCNSRWLPDIDIMAAVLFYLKVGEMCLI